MPAEIDRSNSNYYLTKIFGDALTAQERTSYVRIVEFLSEDALFTGALDAVSRDLWRAYNVSSIVDVNGRFTAALRDVAHRSGFSYPDFAVFTGPLDTPVFLSYVRQGYFWKDAFAPEHGEYSHAFQWLAIRKFFGTRIDVPRLYRRTADIKAQVPVLNAGVIVNDISLWPWLCDCFPYARYKGAEDSDLQHTYSDTYRTPNNVERYVRADRASFIGYIIRYRQRKTMNDGVIVREVMEEYLKDQQVPREERKRNLNDLNVISQSQTLRKERDPRSKPLGNDPKSRVFHRTNPSQRSTPPSHVNIELHGLKGQMPARVYFCTPAPLRLKATDQLRTFRQQTPVPINAKFIG